MSPRRFPFALAAVVLATMSLLLISHEREIAGSDPPNFVLAMRYGYSVDANRPHMPGYPAFYLLWSAIRFLSGFSPHAVLLTTNILFVTLALVLIYLATKRLYDERTAIVASILAASNLLLLYYGSIGEMYVYDAAFSAFMVFLLLIPEIRNQSIEQTNESTNRAELLLYLVYGLLGSFRLSSVILTLPAVALVQGYRSYRTREIGPLIRNSGAFILGLLMWLVPFIIYLDGWNHYLRILRSIEIQTTLQGNLPIFAGITVWMVGVPGLFAIAKAHNVRSWRWDTRSISLFLLFLIPALFFAFQYVVKGYELLLLAPLAILSARALRHSRMSTISVVVLSNLLLFFCMPYFAPSMRSVLNHRNRTNSERMQSALLRCTSVLAPTRAHISVSDNGMITAKQLMASLEPNASVFVDYAAAFWAFPRSLQADFPKLNFIFPQPTDSTALISQSGADMNEARRWPSVDKLPVLYYLTDSELVNYIGKPPGNLLRSQGRLMLYTIRQDSIPALRYKVNRLFCE